MKTNAFVRIFAVILAMLMLVPAFVSCGKDDEKATMLSFKSAAGVDYLKTLHGKKVTIRGWMATSSPVDGSFMFLMNMPYQSCPFCKPNTSELSNTIEVYPKKGSTFSFTNQIVEVTGYLQYTQTGQPFTDSYGYEFDYKIVNAEYVLVKDDNLSPELVLWQKVAESDLITNIYSMFDYLNFVTNWGTYTATFQGGKDYLYPIDAENFLMTDGAQFNYGYKDGYFEDLIKQVHKVDATKLEELVAIIQDGETLAKKALQALENGEYSEVSEYTTNSDGTFYFGDGRSQFKLNDDTIIQGNEDLYVRFYNWFSGWEL